METATEFSQRLMNKMRDKKGLIVGIEGWCNGEFCCVNALCIELTPTKATMQYMAFSRGDNRQIPRRGALTPTAFGENLMVALKNSDTVRKNTPTEMQLKAANHFIKQALNDWRVGTNASDVLRHTNRCRDSLNYIERLERMIIGGYKLETRFGVTVSHYESGQSFHLQGEDAVQFLDEWENYNGDNFAMFLFDFEYGSLLQ